MYRALWEWLCPNFTRCLGVGPEAGVRHVHFTDIRVWDKMVAVDTSRSKNSGQALRIFVVHDSQRAWCKCSGLNVPPKWHVKELASMEYLRFAQESHRKLPNGSLVCQRAILYFSSNQRRAGMVHIGNRGALRWHASSHLTSQLCPPFLP